MYLNQKPILREANSDPRVFKTTNTSGPEGYGPSPYDWRIWNQTSFGNIIRRRLASITDLNSRVFDAGKWVSVSAEITNPATGKTITKDFIIVFEDPKTGAGNIYSSSARWRSIGSVDQAVSYISNITRSFSNSINSI